MFDCCFLLFSLIFGAIFMYLKDLFTPPQIKDKPEIQKKDYKRDTVYLYQYGRLKNCPHLSPFCMKIEVLCRIYKIPYEIVECTTMRSRNGLLPFIELNGDHISDSDLIEMRLKSHFKIPTLSGDLETQSVALSKMTFFHLFHIIYRFKTAEHAFYETIYRLVGMPQALKFLFLPFVKASVGKRFYARNTGAIGDFELKELDEFLHKDLEIIQNTMKGKFLFGDEITAADATVFSLLATVYYPFHTHVSDVLEKDFPKILEYITRVRQEVYPNDFTL
ncbi:Protein CBG22845 [Caenorhabditis briggsae]|uniref:Protein CBG22845 n=1 Tax=Caenorhabditis briggsae TaxID=6238 RepID=A8Y369_CAEBR|nr:Protein CBG22845 [Caenorhabditis briggsae]CAP39338.1 Protein CBG22845 [Caenorhabditis briggsae]